MTTSTTNNDNGNDGTGNVVNDDCDGVTDDNLNDDDEGATGDNDDEDGDGATGDDDDSGGATGDKVAMMVAARQATTTMTMAMARRDTTATTMTMDVDNVDDEGNDASSTMCNEGDNCNRDDGKDACASTATTPAHRRQQRHSQS